VPITAIMPVSEVALGTPVMRYEFKNSQPLELETLTESMQGLSGAYRRYLLDAQIPLPTTEAKLIVTDIRSGSIVLDLVAMAVMAIPYIEPAVTIVSFGDYLGKALRFFTQADREPPVNLSPEAAAYMGDAIAPVANDNGSNLILSRSQIHGPLIQFTQVIHMNPPQAQRAQGQIEQFVKKARQPESRTHRHVLMRWHQARNELGVLRGDRAIIESISPRDVATRIYDPEIKAQMLGGPHENPFREAFVVDVHVETVNGRPTLYVVDVLHETMPIEDE
jgi:hypothetical protein